MNHSNAKLSLPVAFTWDALAPFPFHKAQVMQGGHGHSLGLLSKV